MWYTRHMATNQLPQHSQAELDSKNYWAGLRGSENPPAPSYRLVNGKQKLGRYLDPFGTAALMQETKALWTSWYTGFLVSAGVGALLIEVDWVFICLALPIFAVWYLCRRTAARRRYDHYWSVLQEIESTGQPVWVPYNKDRLNVIERDPSAVWP